MSKLYRVTATIEFYAYADTQWEAESMADEAWGDDARPRVHAHPVKAGDSTAPGWSKRLLVYHDGEEDLALGDVWPKAVKA